jgi:hypothetical protein
MNQLIHPLCFMALRFSCCEAVGTDDLKMTGSIQPENGVINADIKKLTLEARIKNGSDRACNLFLRPVMSLSLILTNDMGDGLESGGGADMPAPINEHDVVAIPAGGSHAFKVSFEAESCGNKTTLLMRDRPLGGFSGISAGKGIYHAKVKIDNAAQAAYELEHDYGYPAFWHTETWNDRFYE